MTITQTDESGEKMVSVDGGLSYQTEAEIAQSFADAAGADRMDGLVAGRCAECGREMDPDDSCDICDDCAKHL